MRQVGQIRVEIDQVATITHIIVFKTIAVITNEPFHIWGRRLAYIGYRHGSRSSSRSSSLTVFGELLSGVEMVSQTNHASSRKHAENCPLVFRKICKSISLRC